MKIKINKRLMLISFMAVVITFLSMAAVFYHIFQAQVLDDLRSYAYALVSGGLPLPAEDKERTDGEGGSEDDYDPLSGSIRVTVVSPEGTVLYDSSAAVDRMDNHADRPEIREALDQGEGRSIRQSATMKRSTFYYTLRLADGNVLRVAKESHSIWSILYSSMPVIAVSLCALLILCLLVSHYLTGSLLAPIEKIASDMDGIGQADVYEELVPFAETIRQQHETILNNANMRQEFSANVSHELKTPLTAISGYSELIENGMASGEDVHRFAGEIHKSANRLLTLIDDTIRLSELDAADKDIPMEEIDLYEIAKDSVEMLQMRAEDRSVLLSVEGSACPMQGDRQMIEELVYNLCDNAINYNNTGGSVMVSVFHAQGCPVLRVKDTGIGIPKEYQERIFERFYRVDKSRSKSTGGTGLGLAIVKHITAVHHAAISLSSEVGKGTDITITFKSIENVR